MVGEEPQEKKERVATSREEVGEAKFGRVSDAPIEIAWNEEEDKEEEAEEKQ